jgi:predicted RecA/RadA family phage recombinase
MQNYRGAGDLINIVTPNILEAGVLEIINGMACVPEKAAAVGDLVAVRIGGEFVGTKATGYVVDVGELLYWDIADQEFNTDTANPAVAVATEYAASGALLVKYAIFPLKVVEAAAQLTRIEDLEAIALNGGTLDLRVDALDNVNGLVFSDSNVGVGDQVNLTDTAAHVFTEKCSVGAAFMVADDFLNIDWSVYVDGSDSTPQVTVEVLVGSTVVDTAVIATAAADDYAAGHTRIKCTAVGGSITGEVKSTQILKDSTVTTPGSIQKAKAITASSTAGFDVTVRATSNAGHASNLATLRDLSISIERASA